MKTTDFEFLANLLKRTSGLSLTPDKTYLLDCRLMPVARRHGLADLSGLVQRLQGKPDPALLKEVSDAMTTNETSFFRDETPFKLFRERVLPDMLIRRAASRTLRIWSAAASTGQEAYSLAIILREQAAQLKGWKIEILGTDICADVLARARAGVYSAFELQRGMPRPLLEKYFTPVGESWEAKPELRSMVSFRECNLVEATRHLGHFDIVFCRNVLIYFDQPTKRRVLDEICRLLPDDGALFLGGAETVLGVSDAFQLVPGCRGVFRVTRVKESIAA